MLICRLRIGVRNHLPLSPTPPLALPHHSLCYRTPGVRDSGHTTALAPEDPLASDPAHIHEDRTTPTWMAAESDGTPPPEELHHLVALNHVIGVSLVSRASLVYSPSYIRRGSGVRYRLADCWAVGLWLAVP